MKKTDNVQKTVEYNLSISIQKSSALSHKTNSKLNNKEL
jgi:hypothetical protein